MISLVALFPGPGKDLVQAVVAGVGVAVRMAPVARLAWYPHAACPAAAFGTPGEASDPSTAKVTRTRTTGGRRARKAPASVMALAAWLQPVLAGGMRRGPGSR
jgi:hypothetical protein